MDTVKVSVVVPCYNEEGAIEHTVRQLGEAFAEIPEHEIIVVNDGSTDRSAPLLDDLATEFQWLRVVAHRRNQGYGASLKTGIRRARGEWIATTDADGTYPNDRLPELVRLAQDEDADMVVGSRTATDIEYPFIRKIPKAFLRTWVSWLAGQAVPDMNSGMRVLKKTSTERFFRMLPDGFSFTTTITLCMLTNRMTVLYRPITYRTRTGRSKIRPIRDTLRFVQLITRTGMYFAPLRLLLPMASVFFVSGIGAGTYDVVVNENLADKTLLLLFLAVQTGMFALLADMIDKRSSG